MSIIDTAEHERFLVKRSRDGVTLTRQKRTVEAVVFAVISGFFLWHAAIDLPGNGDIVDYLLGSILLLIGVALGYYALTLHINTTTVKITRSSVTVNHSPLPWPGNITVRAQEIVQPYVKQREVKRSTKSGTTYTYYYDLYCKMRLGEDILIIKGFGTKGVEKEIEDFLEIEDSPVAGEYRK